MWQVLISCAFLIILLGFSSCLLGSPCHSCLLHLFIYFVKSLFPSWEGNLSSGNLVLMFLITIVLLATNKEHKKGAKTFAENGALN